MSSERAALIEPAAKIKLSACGQILRVEFYRQRLLPEGQQPASPAVDADVYRRLQHQPSPQAVAGKSGAESAIEKLAGSLFLPQFRRLHETAGETDSIYREVE